MSAEFTCGDPAGLAGYLYDECDARERAAIDAHIASCPSCLGELAALGATRTALASWAPPEAKLGFRVTSIADAPAEGTPRSGGNVVSGPARWWQRPLPGWAQAAAAILMFASGALIGVGTTAAPPAVVQAPAQPAASAVSAGDLASLEKRLRAEMHTLRAASSTADARAGAPAGNAAGDAALLERVRALVAESEQRQQRELALRLTQVVRDVDTQRRMDLVRIERTFGQMEGYTRPELADQRDMINYLIRRTGMQRSPQ